MIDVLINSPTTREQGLQFFKVDRANLKQALQFQERIWPRNPVDADYLDKVKYPRDLTNASWLVYYGSSLVGLTGVYTFDPDEAGYDEDESIWMDWFAIAPEHRGHGYGRQILLATIDYAKYLGRFKYFRLDTADFMGRSSTKLYDAVMQLREDYTAEPLPKGHHGLIYSYSLDGSEIRPWNNQFLDLDSFGAAEVVIN